jgi:hypothetical protein
MKRTKRRSPTDRRSTGAMPNTVVVTICVVHPEERTGNDHRNDYDGWLARPDADQSKVGCEHGEVDVEAASRAEVGLEPGRGQHREQRDEHTQQREVGAVREGLLGGVDGGWCRRQ